MQKLYPFLTILVCATTFAAHAQIETNAPKTKIENFELQPDVVIVKGLGDIGSMTMDDCVVTMRTKESSDLANGHKEYGVAVVLDSKKVNGYIVMDDDELNPLINGMDTLGKISYSITTMPSFNAAFTTKSGLEIAAHSQDRRSAIQFYLQFADVPKIPLTSDQFTQFENLVKQAKNSLDELKNKNSVP